MEEKRKLSGKEKFAYGIGAVGKDMVYMLSASYVLYYFQDIMGVSAIAMGVILLIARVFDAFNDPIMGVLVAKTKTKWGKFRPWLFIGTLTNAIILFVMFSAPPSLDGKGLVAYAAIFYILWGVTYTMMDIPYWSMVPAFTEGGKERENLSALARTCAGVGSAIITVVTVMSVSFLGSAVSTKSDSNVDKILNAGSTIVVCEQADDTSTTGNTTEISAEGLVFNADESLFEDAIYVTSDNLDYEITIGSVVFSGDNSSLIIAADSIEEDALIELIVPDEYYEAVLQSDGTASGTLTSTLEVERLGFKYFSLIVAILFFAFICVTCICIKEKSTVDVQTASVGDMFKALVQNDQAMTMVITIVLVNTATYITSNLVIYFFKYDLGGANWQGNYTIFNIFGGAMQILAMMAFFPLLRKFFNTMKVFNICIASAVFGYVILLVMALTGVSNVYPFLVPCFFIMAAVGMLNVIVTVFLANTVDYGELKNHRRDESVIFSMQTFVVKLASGIAALVASICLQIFNISDDDEEIVGSTVAYLQEGLTKIKNNTVLETINNSSVIGLRMVMTIVPIVVLVVGFCIFRKKYILTDAKLEEISTELKARKEA